MTERPQFPVPGKYRRAFEWRVSIPQSSSRSTELEGLSGLARSELPDLLEDFLDLSRKRRANRSVISKLQLYMLQEIVLQEAVVKKCKTRLDELEPDGGPENNANNEIEGIKREMFLFQVYANAIRSIGDGIAWRALDYDRAVIRLMGERATKQRVMSEGLTGELIEWSAHFDRGTGIAILNSLTNCLAVADVTVVRDDGSAEIVEVKSSNTKSRRKIRQKHKMSEVVTLLSSGEGDVEDKEVSIEILPIEPESGLNRIGALLSEAEARGWASDKISNCLYVECFDFEKISSFDSINAAVADAKERLIGSWSAQGDFIVDLNSLDLIAFSPNCAPFSIFPFPSRICIDLLIGRKCYIAYLNQNAVAREFEYRGWTVVKTPEQLVAEGRTNESLLIEKGQFHAAVPPADYMRMQMEALRVQTVISAFEAKFKEGPKASSGFLLHLYEGERVLWD
jgi:hypothetical protein